MATFRVFSNNTQQNTTQSEDWTVVYTAVRWIQLIMAVLSILGAGSIVFHASSKKLTRTPEIQALFLLSVTDMLLALGWLVGAVLFSQGRDNHTTCYNLHTFEQMLYMTSFSYTVNYMWALYSSISTRFYCSVSGGPSQFPRKVSTFCKMAAYMSWVLPVLLMTPVLITGNMEKCHANFSQPYQCLLMHTGALYPPPHPTKEHQITACTLVHLFSIAVFLLAFFFTWVGIVVLIGKSRHIYRRCVTSSGFLGDRQWASLRVVDRRVLLYPSVFLFCWGPAVFLAVLRLYKPTAVEGLVGVVLYLLQAFSSASQGLLNSLVYGWTQSTFRSASKASLRDVDTQTPLLQSQKKGYQTGLRTMG
ncbi:transmembrane protein 116 [Hypomesus transpacificus]|uniref:transmembrane protein 116 n=1 Tax=Hypomesus transpacificus TaxID=137520 RepID=UPI001F084052|nr:transmembrane protein 116 [Hypomesus transpacificus]